MPPAHQITDDAYEPNHEIQELLSEVRSDALMHYKEEETFPFPGDKEANPLSYKLTYNELELAGKEQDTSYGVIISLEGHVGFAASVVLHISETYGEPTNAYIDENNVADIRPSQCCNLMAEWYIKAAVETGFPKLRLKNRTGNLDAEIVTTDRLEEWARGWLAADDCP